MLSISTEKTTISTDKSTASYPAFKQTGTTNNNSKHSSSFERLLNMQIDNSSVSSAINHPKIATTGISDSAPKEYRDRKLAQMEYEIDHGFTEGMELTPNGYRPKLYSAEAFFSDEGKQMSKRAMDYFQTPVGQKETLLFSFPPVKAVVLDKNDNVVAKFYTDDMTGIDPQNITNAIWSSGGVLPTDDAISQLEKSPDYSVIKYGNSSKVTDFDLLKYEVTRAKEQISINPDFRAIYNQQAKIMHPEMNAPVDDVLAFQEKILAA
jgi:hypothetical protein